MFDMKEYPQRLSLPHYLEMIVPHICLGHPPFLSGGRPRSSQVSRHAAWIEKCFVFQRRRGVVHEDPVVHETQGEGSHPTLDLSIETVSRC